MSDKYVYESPDGGKTVTRRKIGSVSKEILANYPDGMYSKDWLDIEELRLLWKSIKDEQKLREEYPALQNAWDQYQVMLKLIKDKK